MKMAVSWSNRQGLRVDAAGAAQAVPRLHRGAADDDRLTVVVGGRVERDGFVFADVLPLQAAATPQKTSP
jgi:hypothetical protein